MSILFLMPGTANAQDAVEARASTTVDVDVPTDTRVRAEGRAGTHTNAQRASKSERREAFEARAAEIRANAATGTDIRAQRTSEARTRVSTQLETRLRTVVANMHERIARHIARLESVADRIEARAVILEDRGIAVDAALTLVADARIALRNASVIINEDLAPEVEAALEADDPRSAFQYVKESIRSAAEQVREAHRLLREAVEELKTAIHAEDGNASGAVRTDAEAEAEVE